MFKIKADQVREFAQALGKSVGKAVTLQGVGVDASDLAVFSRLHDHVGIEVAGEVDTSDHNTPTHGHMFDRRGLLATARVARQCNAGLEIRPGGTVHIGEVMMTVEDLGPNDAIAKLPAPVGIQFEVGTVALYDALAYVSKAMSSDAGRARLWGVNFADGQAQATDGHRLHVVDLKWSGVFPRVFVERPTAEVMLWALKNGSARKRDCPCCGAKNRSPLLGKIMVTVDSAAWRIQIGSVTIAAEHSKISYPPIKQVIRNTDKHEINVDTDRLPAVLPAAALRQGKTGACRFTWADGVVSMSVKCPGGEVSWDPGVVIGTCANEFEPTGFDANLLRDALFDGAKIGLAGPIDPIMIRGDGGKLGVVMPRRL